MSKMLDSTGHNLPPTLAQIEAMTNSQLRDALAQFGEIVGPVVDSTKTLYKRKLINLLTATASVKQKNGSRKHIPQPPQEDSADKSRLASNTALSSTAGSVHTHQMGKGDPAIIDEITALSNDGIRKAFKDLGKDPGPIVASTRHTYEKKLIKLRTMAVRAQAGEPHGFSSDEEDMEWLPV